MKTQFGTSLEADFEEHSWKFLMDANYKVRSGKFAIVDEQVYYQMILCLTEFVEGNIMTAELKEKSQMALLKTREDEI